MTGISTPLVTQAYLGADAGQFWLVKSLGDEPAWPVFICPEEIVLEYFKKARHRPEAARRADGSFSKGYGRSQQLLPVLYLGNLRMYVTNLHIFGLFSLLLAMFSSDSPNTDPQ